MLQGCILKVLYFREDIGSDSDLNVLCFDYGFNCMRYTTHTIFKNHTTEFYYIILVQPNVQQSVQIFRVIENTLVSQFCDCMSNLELGLAYMAWKSLHIQRDNTTEK